MASSAKLFYSTLTIAMMHIHIHSHIHIHMHIHIYSLLYIPLVENLISKEQMHQEAQHMEMSQFLVLRHRCSQGQHNL